VPREACLWYAFSSVPRETFDWVVVPIKRDTLVYLFLEELRVDCDWSEVGSFESVESSR